jgi:hypothetical protein
MNYPYFLMGKGDKGDGDNSDRLSTIDYRLFTIHLIFKDKFRSDLKKMVF